MRTKNELSRSRL